MNEHRYILEPYKGINTRYGCPACNRRDKTFSRYIDSETGEHVNPSVGRCNRESNCGYHYTPKQYFQDNNISFTAKAIGYNPQPVTPQPKIVSFIPVEVFKDSLNPQAYERNHFINYLISLFGVEVASELISRYFIATSKHWDGASVFWQIDTNGKVRTGKIMLYSPSTGKRVKEPHSYITWVHSLLKQSNFELKQCFFGEHLLIDKTKPIAIVESEKTAIIASVYLPQFIWLAVGSLTNLNAEKCSVLKGRTVTLFPDLNGFDKWSQKAKDLSHLTVFTVSDLLERKATEADRKQGLDLADYLVKFNVSDFTTPKVTPKQVPVKANKVTLTEEETKPMFRVEKNDLLPDSWLKEVEDIEAYFNNAAIPEGQFRLNSFTLITNMKKFITSHTEVLKANDRNRCFIPYLDRMRTVKKLMNIAQ